MMASIEDKCASLRAQIATTEAKLVELKQNLADTEHASASSNRWPLLAEEYRRYGRQMIVPQIGLPGQLKLRSAKVLLVGAGGLGCPAAQYLAAAGIGTIGLIDGDTVEISNLHRQVLHRSHNVGKFKVDSAIESLRELNPHPTYIAHRKHLTPEEAPAIFEKYDIILDCTDNPATRYLISDTAVLTGKPLVSASALKTEGQLMVLNNPPLPPGDQAGGPCYRCVFPKPPPVDSVVSCADGGILGPVVGTMGVLQALEGIKVITSSSDETLNSTCKRDPPYLHIFSAYSTPLFRTIRLRSRRKDCAACSADATVSIDTIKLGLTDYVFFCGSANLPNLLGPDERVSPREYREKYPQTTSHGDGTSDYAGQSSHTILDVRDKAQFEICNLESSINIPISNFLASPMSASDQSSPQNIHWLPSNLMNSHDPIYVVCRLGNDSQLAVKKLKDLGLDRKGKRFIGDIRGGLRAWREQIDPEWPEY